MAGEVLSDWGGEALRSLAASSVGPRAHMDAEAVRRLAPHLEAVAQSSALDFTGFPFPEEDDPAALECLAAATLHQYGFWRGTESGYGGAMYASAQNRRFKGSDFIWQAFTRASTVDPSVFEPERMATEGDLFEDLHRADDGSCPVPDIESHRVLHQAYGQDLLAQFPDGFQGAVVQANRSARPAQALLDILATLGGYREDPLAKKANLLVVLLAARPERFLRLDDPESIGPIVDYHVMRGCLRTGCVAIDDPQLRARLTARQWVDVVEEEAIRAATHEAVLALVEETGRSVAEIDGFLFSNGRKRCVEGVEPDCDACPVAEGCAKQVELFQPIYRTTFY